MKVLQVINSLTAGGAEKLIADFVPLMNEKGATTDVLLFNEKEGPFLESLLNRNISVFNIKSKHLYSPYNVFKAVKYFDKYDIVHVHLFPAIYWTSLAKMIRPANWKAKYVLTEHSNSNRRFTKRYLRPVDKFIYARFDALIAISDSVKEVLRRRIGHPDIPVIYSGVNVKALSEAVPVSLPENQVNLLMAAAFRKEKDHLTVIRAMQHLDEHYHLYLAGQGVTEKGCKQLAKDLNVAHRIHFMGVRKDIPGLMKSADICILSSHWEGLSCVVLEAMASGTPFIGTDVNGIKEMFTNNDYALFKTGDVEALTQKIKKLTEDKSFAKQQSEVNFKEVQKFNIEVMTNHYLQLYKRLLKS
jgi:glycosyltransferase involved in cell wall biosynthesis